MSESQSGWDRMVDPAGNWTTWRYPDDRKETQTAVVCSCFPFIRSGQNHLARHSESVKKTRQTKEEVGRHHQGMDRPGVRQVPEGSGEQGKMEKTSCKIICGAPTTLAVKGLMMMMRPYQVEGRTCENDLWPNALELERGILRVRASAEERRSPEGVYGWRSWERYCCPVPVITLQQSVEILYCIHAVTGSHCNDWRMGWTWSSFFPYR